MLSKLTLLLKSKVALAAIGALVVGGGGTAVAAAVAHSNTQANPSAHATATHGDQGDNGNHGHTVAIEGTLKAYDSGAKTISVVPEHETAAQSISVDDNTRVNGENASKLADLASAVGHKVEVQATKQSGGSLLAWKITVEGTPDGGGDNGQSGDHSQKAIHGTVQSVDVNGGSFVVKLGDGSTVTVHVSTSTEFEGPAQKLGDLTTGEMVEVQGTAQSDGSIAANRVQAESGSGSGSGSDGHGG